MDYSWVGSPTEPDEVLFTLRHGHSGVRLIPAGSARLAIGLTIATFGLVALSGPGRIDIVDGQTRYEVSRSLVDDGDVQIRNPEVWFGVFPGRNGHAYTYYRLPHSLAAVPAIMLADSTGGSGQARRHFAFVLCSAAAAALLAAIYLWRFLSMGVPARSALLWAAAGIFCTPSWFYGTSTFDEIFGCVAVTSAMVLALNTRGVGSRPRALGVGLLIGLAFNCKQPLVVFALAALAAADVPSQGRFERVTRAGLLSIGVLAGVAFYVAQDLWKFPPGVKEEHADLLRQYFPAFTGVSWVAPFALALSPAAGALWYFPPILLCVAGVKRYAVDHPRAAFAWLLSAAIFAGFICSLSFFKGDPAWGPRYLTPVFAAAWLFVPFSVGRVARRAVAILLILGGLVQVMGLTVDPYRLYVQRGLPSTFGAYAPLLYFDPANSHLVNRPRELIEIWRARDGRGLAFTPWDPPTATVTVMERVELGPSAVEKYKVLNSFRPWWASHRYMSPDRRPVPVVRTVFWLVALVGVGLVLIAWGMADANRRQRKRGRAEQT
jgi:hypothetical protein